MATSARSDKAGLHPGTLMHIGEAKKHTPKISILDYNEHKFEEKIAKTVEECFPFRQKKSITWINIDGVHDSALIKDIGKHFGFHYLLLAKAKGNTWVKGQSPTPFKKEILSVLFDNPDFQHFDQATHLKDRINCQYGELSDICHTRGQPCSHATLSKANFPRLVEESLDRYVDRTKEVIDLVIICFVVSINPIILFPLPIEEKFGMNGPASGFLEEYQVNVLRKLLKPESLKHLLKYYEFDPGVASFQQWFEEMPDITEEEFKRQLEDFDKFMKDMGPKNVSSKDPANK